MSTQPTKNNCRRLLTKLTDRLGIASTDASIQYGSITPPIATVITISLGKQGLWQRRVGGSTSAVHEALQNILTGFDLAVSHDSHIRKDDPDA